jgi:hypothetical protein
VINNPQEHHRRSIRLKGYDYTQPGAYFVTLCAWQLECLFGEIVEGAMHLNATGRKVAAEWNDLPRHFRNIRLGAFVVMPNHVHGIGMIHDSGHPPPLAGATHPLPEGSMKGKDLVPENPIFSPDGSPLPLPDGSPAQGPPSGSLGAILGQFKSRATKRIWTLPGIDRHPIWAELLRTYNP